MIKLLMCDQSACARCVKAWPACGREHAAAAKCRRGCGKELRRPVRGPQAGSGGSARPRSGHGVTREHRGSRSRVRVHVDPVDGQPASAGGMLPLPPYAPKGLAVGCPARAGTGGRSPPPLAAEPRSGSAARRQPCTCTRQQSDEVAQHGHAYGMACMHVCWPVASTADVGARACRGCKPLPIELGPALLSGAMLSRLCMCLHCSAYVRLTPDC